MSYTRPTASAADATWQGSAAYTRPSASAADASFLAGNVASGFSGTLFGLPVNSGVASGFSTTAFGNATVPVATDSSWNSVVSLLHLDGAVGSAVITDATSAAWTNNSPSTLLLSATQSKFGGSSIYFPPGNTSYINTTTASVGDLTGDFTVELFFFVPSSNAIFTAAANSTGPGLGLFHVYSSFSNFFGYSCRLVSYGSGVVKIATAVGDGVDLAGEPVVVGNAWRHLALSRAGGVLRLSLNGVLGGQTSFAYAPTACKAFLGACAYGSSFASDLYIDEFRVTRGVGRYPAAFTPPTAAFGNVSPPFNLISSAAGFSGTFLGAPNSFVTFSASGFVSTVFSTPTQTVRSAVGIGNPVLLGTPAAAQFFNAASTGPVSIFGTPTSPVNLIANAQGFKRNNFGAPFGLRNTTLLTNYLCQAFGFTGSFVSDPTSGSLQIGSATGFTSTQLSAPTAVSIQGAVALVPVAFGVPGVNFATYPSSLVLTQLGVPALRLTQTAAGFTSLQLSVPNAVSVQSAAALVLTYFGTPSAIVVAHPDSVVLTQLGAPSLQLTQAAISSAQQALFGSPSSSRSRTYLTYGIYQGDRIGQPAGFVRFNRTATGFCSAVSGTPSASFRNRAAHIAPGASFGQARLNRASTC